jgi:PPOX class probable F420-dependent enzyme
MIERVIDESTEFGARVARRLRDEIVVWMTTVTPAGVPVPRPVWFVWDGGDSVLMYSQPKTRIRNLEANPRVSLHFDGDGEGGDIVFLSGTAEVDRAAPPAHEHREYLTKYERHIARLGMSEPAFAEAYSVPVRIRVARVGGH